MKNRPIHENLDTSFVNLSALVKYLRRRRFVGTVKIRLNGYNAEIFLSNANELKVSEHDLLSGRVGEGEEALQRILIRAREPGGTINVFQQMEDSEEIPAEETTEKFNLPIEPNTVQTDFKPIAEESFVETIPEPIDLPQNLEQNVEIKPIEKPQTIADPILSKTLETSNANSTNSNPVTEQKPAAAKPAVSLPDFPFRLSNKVEERAKKVQEVSSEDWQTLLNLTVELLGTIDKQIARGNLDFTSAFKMACAEIADDYPFLNPSNNTFAYSKGRMKMTEQINPKIFTASIVEAISRILEKLESNPKFAELHRATVQTILALINKRRKLYDDFEISSQLKKVLSV